MQYRCSFYVSDETFTQIDGVALGLLLAPILAGIFMVKLERNLIPIIKDNFFC